MKTILSLLLAFAVVACAGVDQATKNRDTLGSAQTIWIEAQRFALAYRDRPRCPSPVQAPCRDPATYAKMQDADRISLAAIRDAKLKVEQTPDASTATLAVDAAMAAVKSYLATAKGAR